jgi:hypothetical protein
MELLGRKVRVLLRREGDNVVIEVASIWDVTYRKPLTIIANENNIKEEVDAVVQETTQLLRETVEKLNKQNTKTLREKTNILT